MFYIVYNKSTGLKALAANREKKTEVKPRPITSFSNSTKLPHEKEVELGEIILKKKAQSK